MNNNLCLITSPLPPNVKGAQILVDNFLEILEPISNTIYLITGNYEESLSNKQFNLINLKLDDKQQSMVIRMLKFISTQFKISWELLKIKNNIDAAVFFISTPFSLPMLTAKLSGKRVIMIATGSSSKGAKQLYKKSILGIGSNVLIMILSFLEKVNYYFADDIIVLSKKLVNDIGLEKYQNKINYACATFVDVNTFSIVTNLNERDNIVGFVGRLTETKGIMQFVKAIQILSDREDLTFFIGGDGHLKEEVENELSKTNFKHLVTFKGWISHEELPKYLNLFKLIVIPSYTEAFPAVGLEAMACGTPVLITPVGGVLDIIQDGKTGFIMENNSPEVIAKNILRVLKYHELEQISINARYFLENNFSYDHVTRIYKKILKRND